MNREKILELANVLENAKPESFHMGSWFGELVEAEQTDYWPDLEDLGFEYDELVPYHLNKVDLSKIIDTSLDTITLSCDTTACIAGWTIANEFFQKRLNLTEDEIKQMSTPQVSSMAENILGLTSNQSRNLFFCEEGSIWDRLSEDYDYGDSFVDDHPETWKIHPKIAADVLRRIANGEIDLN